MTSSPPVPEPTRSSLASRSFIGLVLTQFLGAFNDNMFRWLVVPIGQTVPALGTGKALALGGVSFTIPYLVLAPAAGSLADRFSKRTVIVACKLAEVLIMLMGLAAIFIGNVWLLFGVVMLMGAQSALFGPAKFGSLPEMLALRDLSSGNGIMGLVTVIASALGTVAGYALYSHSQPDIIAGVSLSQLTVPAGALIGVAAAGLIASLLIGRLPAAHPGRRLTINPITDTLPALRTLFSSRALTRAALGIGFFWFLASLCQLTVDRYGDELLGLEKAQIGVLLATLVAGVGSGSVLAGLWSGGKIELGIVPLGALGIVISALLVFLSGSTADPNVAASLNRAYYFSSVSLFLLGTSAGLFNIPLEAFLQERSDVKLRGTILAGSNFLSFSFILVSCGLFYVMNELLEMSPAEIFMVAGLGTIPVCYYVFRILPDMTVRFLFWLASHSLYRLRIKGAENIPDSGGALLVANHVSWVDGILVLVSSSRLIRFLIWGDFTEKPGLRQLARAMRVIPIKATGGPKALVQSIHSARSALQEGELVCIFAEGQLTRTGQLQTFQPGLLKIISGTGCPVVPVYLHGLWGSIFSYHGGKFFWKRPRQWPYPITIVFGKPLSEPEDVYPVRRAVEDLGVTAMALEKPSQLIPARQFVRQCKRRKRQPKVADSSRLELSASKLLIGSLAMKRLLERSVFEKDERMVGLLLPPSVGGCLANMAVSLTGRTTVNLNYTLDQATLDFCARDAGLKHVLTSRRFLEKRPFELSEAEFVYLEDLKEQITGLDKGLSALATYVLPTFLLERWLRLTRIDPDEICTIIFTSGSTGEPKGVMLSHYNVGSNVDAVEQLLQLESTDTLIGVLPFFHSFGYTATLWLPMCFDAKVVYHFNPLDSRIIGELCQKHGVTIGLATPTFLRSYLKRVTPEQFARLDTMVVGAEKLPLDLARQFEEKFGVQPSEGYGTTELSPVAAVNIPDHRSSDITQIGTKLGTVGRPIPGVIAKVVDADTWEDLGLNTEGLLLIKGPNVMKGYLHHPERTAEVIRDGWYNTGDFGCIDDDGFVRITGRQSRFSKIAGEMVPHLRIEEELTRIVDDPSTPEPDLLVAVTSVPDERKGERLIILHKQLPQSVDEILKQLSERGLPNLWLPSADSFLEVDEIPLLGTGKLDLRRLKEVALAHFNHNPVEQSVAGPVREAEAH